MAEVANSSARRVPVTILTGYLGAGKTTLLNHLLSQQTGVRCGVIENEYGAVNIDGQLVAMQSERAAESLVQLDNGCVCCTVRGDLVGALRSFASKELDLVIIETTGLADPIPVAKTILAAPEVADAFFMDGVIAVADAMHLELQLDRGIGSEAWRQLAFADRVLLNKTDLVAAPAQLEALEARVRAVNPGVTIVRAQWGVVEPALLLNLHAFELRAQECIA